MCLKLFQCAAATRTLPTAGERSVRLREIEGKLEVVVGRKEPWCRDLTEAASATPYLEGIFCLCKGQARVLRLVTVWIPNNALCISWYHAICGPYWVCVAVFAGSRDGERCGGVSEVAKIPSKGDIFAWCDLVKRGGGGWG